MQRFCLHFRSGHGLTHQTPGLYHFHYFFYILDQQLKLCLELQGKIKHGLTHAHAHKWKKQHKKWLMSCELWQTCCEFECITIWGVILRVFQITACPLPPKSFPDSSIASSRSEIGLCSPFKYTSWKYAAFHTKSSQWSSDREHSHSLFSDTIFHIHICYHWQPTGGHWHSLIIHFLMSSDTHSWVWQISFFMDYPGPDAAPQTTFLFCDELCHEPS